MFDVGFQEITLIGLIALIVIGAERLPRMARTLGLWMGKIRFYVNQVKSDIDREVRAQELKEMLDKPARELDDLKRVAEETKGTLDRARGALGEAKASFDGAVTGTSTANEPAAGSIFPTELPGAGPVRPESSGTTTAPCAETAPPPSDSPETASALSSGAAPPSSETAPPPSDLPETTSVSSAETNPAPSHSPETAPALSTGPASPSSDSPPAVSAPPAETNPTTEIRDPTARPEPAATGSGAPEPPSAAMQARENDERASERH